MAWSVFVGAVTGFVVYLIALAVNRNLTSPRPATTVDSPLAALTRNFDEFEHITPAHGTQFDERYRTDPSLPVQLSLALNIIDTPPHGTHSPTTDPNMTVQPPGSETDTPPHGTRTNSH